MIFLLLACFSGGGDGGCDGVFDAVQHEECLFQEATRLGTDKATLKNYIAQIPDPSSQDLLRIRLSVRDPARLQWLCEDVSTRSAQDRCRQVVGRPHLRQKKKADR
jgi:hypothetical protein